MSNGTEPDKMTSAKRLDEVAVILASAMLRLRAKHASSPKKREFPRDNSLGCPGETRPPAVNL
jgi:hypothetical protein